MFRGSSVGHVFPLLWLTEWENGFLYLPVVTGQRGQRGKNVLSRKMDLRSKAFARAMLSYLTFCAIFPSPPWQAINISSAVAHVMPLRVIPGLTINQAFLAIPVA